MNAVVWKLALSYLGSYWREVAIVVLVGVVLGACHARDTALTARGRSEERARVADSTLKALKPQLAKVDTVVVHDTLTVRHAIQRVVTLRDTVLEHLTDTVLVKQYVQRTDSLVQVCSEVTHDCQEFREKALATIHALEQKAALPTVVTHTPPRSRVLYGAGGLILGWFLHR